MKDDERDDRDGDVPPEERARAHRLSRLVDDMLAGEPAPPALDADDRALLETATSIHAAMGKASLEPARVSRLVEAAYALPGAGIPPLPAPSRLSWLRRRGPWLVAAVSAAAAIVFVLMDPPGRRGQSTARAPAQASPDQLVGRIERDQAGEASRRLDVIYADRLSGYRSARLGPGLGRAR